MKDLAKFDTTTKFTIECVRSILGLPKSASPAMVIGHARAQRPGSGIAALVASLYASEGFSLGSGSRDEVRRAIRRNAVYEHTCLSLQGRDNIAVLKGPIIGSMYPSGVIRPVGDLDLVCPAESETNFWQHVASVRGTFKPERLSLTRLKYQDQTHLVVELSKKSDDALLDRSLRVEIGTFGFIGHGRQVPFRCNLPESILIRNLLAVAEERFSRDYVLSDILDAQVLLSQVQHFELEDLVINAAHWNLAPELLELVTLGAQASPELTDTVNELKNPLSEAAACETSRRAAAIASVNFDISNTPIDSEGFLRERSIEIRRTKYSPNRSGRTEFDEGIVTATPVGFFFSPTKLTTRGSINSARERVRWLD